MEELKKRFEDYRKDYEKRKEHIREEAGRRSKSLSEDNRHLQKELSAKKHEAQALISEMDCTAQAFEDMQEQNIRLLEQIKEKDDANFKLMSERIKSNSVHKLLLQEKGLMTNQLTSLSTETQRWVGGEWAVSVWWVGGVWVVSGQCVGGEWAVCGWWAVPCSITYYTCKSGCFYKGPGVVNFSTVDPMLRPFKWCVWIQNFVGALIYHFRPLTMGYVYIIWYDQISKYSQVHHLKGLFLSFQ